MKWMKWTKTIVGMPLLPLLGFASASFAETVPWVTDAAVGQNQVVYTVALTCPNVGFVCNQIDGYSEQDTSIVAGGATFDLDDDLDQIQFDSDSSQDVGAGLQPAYLTVTGSDLAFPAIAFAGVPEITDVAVFALTNPVIPVPGLQVLLPGDYPFSQTISYSALGTVFGDLEFILGPDIIVAPDDVLVTGTLRVLGDPDLDGFIEFELRDVTGTFNLQNIATIGGESVTVDVTADMTLNLSGEVEGPSGGVPVPALGPAGSAGLVVSILLGAAFANRRRTNR